MLIQVFRIFDRCISLRVLYVFHVLLWVTLAYHLITIFLMIFTCWPVTKGWRPWEQGKCMSVGTIAMTMASINLITDITILTLWQSVVWSVTRRDPRKRAGLSVVFAAGLV
jgi:hypothetical protein